MVHRFHRGFTAAEEEKRSYGIAGKRGESLKAIGASFWEAVIVDLFFGGSAWWDSSLRSGAAQGWP